MQSSTETALWAGSIVRYHNRPTAQRQTVGEHTWRVLVIYTEFFGLPRAEVYKYIIYHDVAEVITGDIPFMAKRRYPQLKQVLHHIELDHVPKILGSLPEITKDETEQVKIADLLEMLFFAVDDVNMGCWYSVDIIENILEVLRGTPYEVGRYIELKGYQRSIDTILATRARENAPATDSERISDARNMHRTTDGNMQRPDKLGQTELQPKRNDLHDYAQSG